MEGTNNKPSKLSRCREWERNRRNKFNDAIARLGELVKEINSLDSGTKKEGENVQYAKVEIVEKAIICLANCSQEKAKLKAEILALQVKIDTDNKTKENKKDASTQVFIGITKKSKNDKCVKVLMLQKSKRKVLKEKPIFTANVTVENAKTSNKKGSGTTKPSILPKPPFILPKQPLGDKKGPENTIVVLPATPYIFPQRSLILPTVPPAFVLVDNVQTLNKSTIPIINRNNNDITKTTMVNILPISAYSHALSATKLKKNSPKIKHESSKKTKKSKATTCSKELVTTVSNDVPKSKSDVKISPQNKQDETNKVTEAEILKESSNIENCKSKTKNDNNISKDNNNSTNNIIENNSKTPEESSKVIDTVNTSNNNAKKDAETMEVEKIIPPKDSTIIENIDEKNKTKVPVEKEIIDKDKENKLPNILDTALCENTVDGGNARLELAEEFLAASPTAAFLMSFPLVSGNRAESPADETPSSIQPSAIQVNPKDTNERRNEIASQSISYFEKPVDIKVKQTSKSNVPPINLNKQGVQHKYANSNVANKQVEAKNITTTASTNTSNDNPFLNLPLSSLLPTSCSLPDTTFGLDFDCTTTKSMPSQTSNYASNSNLFYKSDPFSTVKSTIYSTSNISSGHEFNSFALYPCAMEKYTAKNKTDYPNVEENLMKIGSSRLTYDIDLGWSHKGFDFVSCSSTSNTFSKDNILTTAPAPYSTSYNPFNPDFHVPLVSNSNKKDNSTVKISSSFPEAITSFYSQPSSLWTEDVPFYTNNNNASKVLTSRHQNYLSETTQTNSKVNISKQYESKLVGNTPIVNSAKSHTVVNQQISDKYNKKSSPSKMHINWMTSEIRPMQSNCNSTQPELKETHKPTYNQLDQVAKKQDHSENNYFPISMHNFPTQTLSEDLQAWSSTRAAGTTEISIEPPPINLPTLVGDLALGPHDKKKTLEISNRVAPQSDIQNCSNFFSVTQLMNRSSDNNMTSRYQVPSIDTQKAAPTKQNVSQNTNDANRKNMSRIESHVPQPCYVFNDSKSISTYENMSQFSQNKHKANKSDKSTKVQKNSYSAEALIRGGTCNQKLQDNNSAKFLLPPQKYNDFNASQDTSVAQVSHFPPILDYSDNNYTGQQFSGTNLYNSTTNTISNSFYSNFMPGSSNLMTGNYTSAPFSGDFIDYNQTAECNYSNHKYTELKMRNNPAVFQQEKVLSNYKSSRRESTAKHKLECSKKDSGKKCQNKRAKLTNEVEEWNDSSHLLWQNKTPTKRHSNLMSEELPFPNYVGNQMPGQYQPEFFNSHLMPSNMQPVSHNVDRSLASFPVTSRANFNLSTIFPEITMKVQ